MSEIPPLRAGQDPRGLDQGSIAIQVVNSLSAMVAYWDSDQKCVFANSAYLEWFGRTPGEMKGISMKELLGPLYVLNLPHILAALDGKKQVFERPIPLAGGEVRESIATYTPNFVDGRCVGFSVHVADVTVLRNRERELEVALKERDEVRKELRTLHGLLPICAGCKDIRDANGNWQPLEEYVSQRTNASFTHGMCPQCIPKYYPGLLPPAE